MIPQQGAREEYAVVLDFLPHGYPLDKSAGYKKTPIIQAIGQENFVLVELVPKKDIHVNSGDLVYIGSGKRDHIHHINGKLALAKLTNTAKGELEFVAKKLIAESPQKFVDFFNKSQPLSMRMHQLELLPGLGKKHMWEVVEERRAKPFESFVDIKARVKLLPNPESLVFRRIMKELEGDEKHHLFVKE
jgi:putative nucleotide binding protein